MPLWTVHTSTGTYSAQDKHDLARDITGHYTRIGLPAFYVVVVFEEHEPDSFFIGGETARAAVRFAVEHIAVHGEGPKQHHAISRSMDELLKPHTSARGLYYEVHVDETPRELWRVGGLEAPPFGSAAEARWAAANAPSPWREEER